MEIELKGIISRIKEEGVDVARKEADELVLQAQKKSKTIVEKAVKEKEEILKNAKSEAEKMKANSEAALKQASRDVLLSLKENVVGLFNQILKQEVRQQLSADVIKEMILQLAGKFEIEKQSPIEILLNEKDKKVLEQALLSKVKKKLEEEIILKSADNIDKGFRVGKKGEHTYYDFTDEAIAEKVSVFLNPSIREILK
ncbi:MAG: hypothetical protein ABH844_01375 [Candidatus Omnitrophota bacterium]